MTTASKMSKWIVAVGLELCLFLIVLVIPFTFGQTSVRSIFGKKGALPPTCESNVYCKGNLLHDAQLSDLYIDSKIFVDKKLKYPENQVVSKYEKLRSEYGGKTPPKEVIQKFVDENFEDGDELQVWNPSDFTATPKLLRRISDPNFKTWASDLCGIFRNLSRKVKDDVYENPGLYSLLYVPNGFVIPGGRFDELYYWDTYWILSGLLLCDMVTTARGVIENFLYLLKDLDHIPNGSRKYYIERSQPPLLILMVDTYFRQTRDLHFVRTNINLLEKEFSFWMKNRMVEVKKNNKSYKLARYFAPSAGPRPESYREDFETASFLPTEEKKNILYTSIKSAAESGFDFSSRWFIKNGTNDGDLRDIDTPNIVPVDLNAFLEYNARILSSLHIALGDKPKAAYYKFLAQKLLTAIEAVLWNKERGIWLDYDLKNRKPRDYFYMSNFCPLWTGGFRMSKQEISTSVLNYINEFNIDDFIGGVPTSLTASGQQWDFPNGWPPLEDILVIGLFRLPTPAAKLKAQEIAKKWLDSNYKGFTTYNTMFEKYDVQLLGQTGSGGEYEAQTGFGWTNGVVLRFLEAFGQSISSSY